MHRDAYRIGPNDEMHIPTVYQLVWAKGLAVLTESSNLPKALNAMTITVVDVEHFCTLLYTCHSTMAKLNKCI